MYATWEAQVGKDPAFQCRRDGSSREDPLEEETARHSSVLARRTPWTQEAGGRQCTRSEGAGRR